MAVYDIEGDSKLEQFLKSINIENEVIESLKSRDVSMEELLEFEIEDLKEFVKDLKLDILSTNRFIKSIVKMKQKQHVIVSPEEHEGIIKLYEEYENCSTSMTNIQKNIETLNKSELNVIKDIENVIDSLINKIKNKKQSLLFDIDNLFDSKIKILEKQLNSMENYIKIVNDGKLKYDEYININTNDIDIKERKKLNLKMMNDILNKKDISISLLTQSNIQFNYKKYNEKLNKLYQQSMKINDCDQPKQMKLELMKITDDSITINFALNEYDINGTKKVKQIVLEYAILPKSYIRKQQKKKKKKRKYTESENDESDDDKIYDDDIMKTLKWKKIEIKIKSKIYKKDKKNKYKIERLKEERGYLIRIRAGNKSGFGVYSKILNVITKKTIIKFDKYDKEYVRVEDNGKKVCIIGDYNGDQGCIYTTIQSSKGFKSGIKKWKIAIDPNLSFDQDMEQIGVCSVKFNNLNFLKNIQITSKQCGHGIATGTGLINGDIISIELNFNKMKCLIKKNDIIIKQEVLLKDNKYYPVIQCCICSQQCYTLLTR